ncbi:right-handed parallel beta-helix repeat-containing protein [Microbacterium sp.]|uniref:right-handed parallel beta-helix repeat-containing protein n=1 Tax=Microbacterium sp. TaxID=51671 RepID=UPI0037CCB519
MKISKISIGAAARVAVAATVAIGTIATAPAASALSTADVTVDGAVLAGTTRASGVFDLAVRAPAGVKVKFRLDGTYLGQDSTAPYTWPIRTTSGTHTLNVRWEDEAGRHETDATFTVAAAATGAQPTAPKPTPTASAPTAPAAGSGTAIVTVSTSAQLASALKSAKPGQTIRLNDGTYTGEFAAAASGTASQRITLTGSSRAVLTTGKISSGYALHITGDHWNVSGLTVTRAAKGIVLDGSSYTVIDGVDVGDIGAEAVHLRTGSTHVTVRNSRIHDTGRDKPSYGEGIYIGSAKSNWSSIMGSSSTPDRSDHAQIIGNTISRTSAEGIDIKEGTTGGVVSGNTFSDAGYSGQNYGDSWVDVKGNGYQLTGNRGSGTLLDAFQVHVALSGWGQGNVFRGNSVTGGVPGYEVSVQSGATGTVVACAPSGAAKGLTNITCTR